MPFGLVVFAAFALAGFVAFADFLGAFAFFGVVVSVVVSLIIFSFVLSASDDTFITPVRKEGEVKTTKAEQYRKDWIVNGNEVRDV